MNDPEPGRRLGLLTQLKRRVRAAISAWRLRQAVRRIAALGAGTVPDLALLEELRMAWGNPGYTAVVEYLQEVAQRAVETPGPIFECGAGLTTVLLGLLAGRRGVEIWSLEHDAHWHARVGVALRTFGIQNVRLLHAPLVSRGAYSWYEDPPGGWPPNIRFVVCDGPPSSTPGGRYGLIPTLRQSLAAGAVILLDDSARPEEQDSIRRWSKEMAMDVAYGYRPSGTFAVITLL